MKTSAAKKEMPSIRSRHKSFFKRLDVFLKNYSQGICGPSVPDESASSIQPALGAEAKERR